MLGCGGDRDRAKRPLMGAAAAGLADIAILTSDNPRSEDPLAHTGGDAGWRADRPARDRAHVIVEPDRGAAIGLAVAGPPRETWCSIAGKGHERGQYAGTSVIPFDDREVAASALASRLAAAGERRRAACPADASDLGDL